MKLHLTIEEQARKRWKFAALCVASNSRAYVLQMCPAHVPHLKSTQNVLISFCMLMYTVQDHTTPLLNLTNMSAVTVVFLKNCGGFLICTFTLTVDIKGKDFLDNETCMFLDVVHVWGRQSAAPMVMERQRAVILTHLRSRLKSKGLGLINFWSSYITHTYWQRSPERV